MSITIAVLSETQKNEKRIALSPDMVKKYVDLGCTIKVQSGAGRNAAITDDALKEAGARIGKTAEEACKGADILLCVQPPADNVLAMLKKGALVIGMLAPYQNDKLIKDLADKGLNGFSMELLPRITRAQAMDVLSSQANLAGYKAVLDACEYFGRAMPMMMTAAGTVPPAKLFVMGAGVAGLQAIATAKRLGAIVSATDVRPAAKEQVESLGGSFVAVEDEEFRQAETGGGYAKEMSKEYQKKQHALIEEHIAKQDIVITTALIPGKPAPKLVTDKMVRSMKPGAVIVDMAAPQGGNCTLTSPGKVIEKNNVTIIGHKNIPARLAASASLLYAKNLFNLVNLLIDKESGKIAIEWDDDIIKGLALTRNGKIVHPDFVRTAAKKESTGEPAKKKTSTAGKKTSTAKKASG